DPGPAGTISLRQAIDSANASDGNTVAFDASLVGSTITLSSGIISIFKQMFIVGPGADRLTISGNDASQIFKPFDCVGTVYISGLHLTHGSGARGGAIYAHRCDLNASHIAVTASHATSGGGVAAQVSALTIDH